MTLKITAAMLALAWSIAGTTLASPGRSSESIHLKAQLIRIDGGKFYFGPHISFMVRDVDPVDARVHIRCDRCAASFSERVTGELIGVLADNDYRSGSLNIITVWEGSTDFLLHVYHVEKHSARRVVQTTSNLWPSFTRDAKGRPIIVVPDLIDIGTGEKFPKLETVWRWNGSAFVAERRAFALLDPAALNKVKPHPVCKSYRPGHPESACKTEDIGSAGDFSSK